MDYNSIDVSIVTFDGEKIGKIFQKIRITEQLDTGPLTQLLGLESLTPCDILRKGIPAVYKVVDEKKFIFSKLKYSF